MKTPIRLSFLLLILAGAIGAIGAIGAEKSAMSDVVKTTVYLTRAEDFAALNGVYGKRMGDHKPARSTVIVAALPRNAPVEIELVARARR